MIAEDSESYSAMIADKNRKYSVVLADDGDVVKQIGKVNGTAAFDFQTDNFLMLMTRRPFYVNCLIALGYDVLLSDIDTVWLKDPFPYFKNESISLFTLSDSNNIDADPRTSTLCAGFMLLKSSDMMEKFTHEWMDSMLARDKNNLLQNDQAILNKMVSWHRDRTPGFCADVLPYSGFVSGAIFFNTPAEKLPANLSVVHNNWIVGHDSKKERFIKAGLWQVDGSNQGRYIPDF